MILVIDNAGRRLCKDKNFRDFAPFGTFTENVKTYKQLGRAKNIARSQNALAEYKGKDRRFYAVQIPDNEGWTIDASGAVMRDIPTDTPGMVRTEKKYCRDFIVKD